MLFFWNIKIRKAHFVIIIKYLGQCGKYLFAQQHTVWIPPYPIPSSPELGNTIELIATYRFLPSLKHWSQSWMASLMAIQLEGNLKSATCTDTYVSIGLFEIARARFVFFP